MLDSLLSFLGGGNGLIPPSIGQANPQTPPQAGAQGPAFGDRLMAGAQGFFNAQSPMGAIGGLLSGLSSGQSSDAARQQQVLSLYTSLRARGLSDADAKAAALNPKMLEILAPVAVPKYEAWNNGQVSGSFNPASGNIAPQVSVPTFKSLSPGETGGEYAPTIPGVSLPMQRAPQQTGRLPSNDLAMSVPPRQVADANSAPMTPRPVPTTPVPPAYGGFRPMASGGSVVQQAADQAQGKAMGEARQAYPETVATISTTLNNIKALKEHPGLEWNTGNVLARGVGWAASNIGGTDSADFRARLEQIKSQGWMSAIQQMKGLGALSNAEGSRVETAWARLQTTQDPAAFKKSLGEIEDILQSGLTRARLQSFGQQRLQSGNAFVPPPPGFTVIGQ